MNLLGPDDTCPRCAHTDVPAEGSGLAGVAAYVCPVCGHTWTTAWHDQPRLSARVREYELLDPSRFAEPDDEGRYVYDDEDDW